MIKYLLKNPLAVIAYLALIVVVPNTEVRLAGQTAVIIDTVGKDNIDSIKSILLSMLIMFIIITLLKFFVELLRIYIIRTARIHIKEDMFRTVIGLNNGFFHKQVSGSYVSAFSNDISILEYNYFSSVLEELEGIFTLLTYISALVTLNTTFAVIIMSGELLSLFLCLVLKKHLVKKGNIYIDTLGKFTQRIKDLFSSVLTIKNYSAEKGIIENFNCINTETETTKSDFEILNTFADSFVRFWNCMNAYAIVAIGSVLALKGEITVASIFLAYNFTNNLANPMRTIIYKINAIHSSKSIVQQIKKLINVNKAEKKLSFNKAGSFTGIKFENVSFSQDGQSILSEINVSFEPQKKYLIIGKNGCGKSSLLKLLVRETDKYSGKILIGETNIRTLPYSEISKYISYINENVLLLTDTVYNNITLYNQVSSDAMENAVKMAQLHVPTGRVLQNDGKNISSGERRRIEIARCLLNESNMLIFDESISTLDISTAYDIEKMMLDMVDKTVIFVSHNFSGKLIYLYDQIILMDSGKIIAKGTHDELIRENKEYCNIIRIKNGKIV